MNAFSKPSTPGAGANNTKSNNNSNAMPVTGGKKQQQQQQRRKPIIPFGKKDRVLLVGEGMYIIPLSLYLFLLYHIPFYPILNHAKANESLTSNTGDFSFARSLTTQHKCLSVLATCYDDKETLCGKYPHTAEENINAVLDAGPGKRRRQPQREDNDDGNKDEDENPPAEGHSSPSEHKVEAENQTQRTDSTQNPNGPRVLYSIDARKLGATGGGGKEVRSGFARRGRRIAAWKKEKQQQQQQKQKQQQKRKRDQDQANQGGPWDIICFNFPHVGGISTDVNRQVRYNQELLVGFFKACVPLLSIPEPDSGDVDDEDEDDEFESDSESDGETGSTRRTEPGQILVTLFEGEPYTLWNIKELAKHAGLRTVTSFRFPWASYEGYSHARTLGEVEGKHGGRGGWRGEDREARMYVFENAQVQSVRPRNAKRKKRGRNDSDSDSD